MVPPEGRLAGRYELIEPIGTGSLGVVWHARDAALGQSVRIAIGEEPERLREGIARLATAWDRSRESIRRERPLLSLSV